MPGPNRLNSAYIGFGLGFVGAGVAGFVAGAVALGFTRALDAVTLGDGGSGGLLLAFRRITPLSTVFPVMLMAW